MEQVWGGGEIGVWVLDQRASAKSFIHNYKLIITNTILPAWWSVEWTAPETLVFSHFWIHTSHQHFNFLWSPTSRASLRSEKSRQNIDIYLGFIGKIHLFWNRREAQPTSHQHFKFFCEVLLYVLRWTITLKLKVETVCWIKVKGVSCVAMCMKCFWEFSSVNSVLLEHTILYTEIMTSIRINNFILDLEHTEIINNNDVSDQSCPYPVA